MKTFAVQPVNVASAPAGYEKAGPEALLALIPGFPGLPPESVQGDVLLVPSGLPSGRIRRLVVLVPSDEIAESLLARRVWQLATSSGLQVLYLALSPDDSQAPYQRRRLAGLAAVTADPEVRAQAKVSAGKSWSQALEGSRLPGDLVVCLMDHKVLEGPFRRKSLGEQLAGASSLPVYLLSGVKISAGPGWKPRMKEVLIWTIFLAQLAAFFALQVWVDRLVGKPASTILFCLLFVAEVYLLVKTGEWLA